MVLSDIPHKCESHTDESAFRQECKLFHYFIMTPNLSLQFQYYIPSLSCHSLGILVWMVVDQGIPSTLLALHNKIPSIVQFIKMMAKERSQNHVPGQVRQPLRIWSLWSKLLANFQIHHQNVVFEPLYLYAYPLLVCLSLTNASLPCNLSFCERGYVLLIDLKCNFHYARFLIPHLRR